MGGVQRCNLQWNPSCGAGRTGCLCGLREPPPQQANNDSENCQLMKCGTHQSRPHAGRSIARRQYLAGGKGYMCWPCCWRSEAASKQARWDALKGARVLAPGVAGGIGITVRLLCNDGMSLRSSGLRKRSTSVRPIPSKGRPRLAATNHHSSVVSAQRINRLTHQRLPAPDRSPRPQSTAHGHDDGPMASARCAGSSAGALAWCATCRTPQPSSSGRCRTAPPANRLAAL